MIKSGLLTLLILLGGFIVFASYQAVYAQGVDLLGPDVCNLSGGGEQPAICDVDNVNKSASDNVLVGANGILTRLAQWLVWASGIAAMILIIIAGLMFIFSQGNSESVGRARSTVIYAVIGMAIAVVGQAIVSFVLVRLS